MVQHILPELPQKIGTYYEPFLGGGAVFFALAREKRFKRAVINDSNRDLFITYRVIQQHVDDLILELGQPKYVYDKDAFEEMRAVDTSQLTHLEQAARFVYLLKTCFNGLWRVNRAGRFNTPFGRFKNPLICDADNLRAISKVLKNVEICNEDFAKVVSTARKGDAVYFDPPYLPISETSSFTGYNAGGFGEIDHWRLRGVFGQLASAGVTTVLSNSHSPKTLSMYADFEVRELVGSRNIGGPASYRNAVPEIMVIGRPAKAGERVA